MSQVPFDREFYPVSEKPSVVGPYYAEAIPTSQLAIVSLVFGIMAYVFLPLVGAVIAVVTGHIALGQIRESGGQFAGRGMAKAGLILGYAQFALLAVAAVLAACVVGWGMSVARDVEVMTPATPTTTVEVRTTPAPSPAPDPAVPGVKMVNQMGRADFKLIADAGVEVDPAEIVAFYNAGEPARNPEFALVTTGSVVYLKDGGKTSFDFEDVAEIKDDTAFEKLYHTRKDPGGGDYVTPDGNVYHIEVRHKGGNRMRIEIRPELAGVSFFESLRSAIEAAVGKAKI